MITSWSFSFLQQSMNVATNVGQTFPKILNEEFRENYVLHKIFNRITTKISYTCMTNMKQTIDGQQQIHLESSEQSWIQTPSTTNVIVDRVTIVLCWKNALQKQLYTQATVTTKENKPDETYVGLTANTFKTRSANR